MPDEYKLSAEQESELITAEVNRILLKLHIWLQTAEEKNSDKYERALSLVDNASEIACHYNRHELKAKAELYRGHCYRGLKMWKKAHACYVAAAPYNMFLVNAELESLTRECKEEMKKEKVLQKRSETNTADFEGSFGKGRASEPSREKIFVRDADGSLIDIIDKPDLRRDGRSVASLREQ